MKSGLSRDAVKSALVSAGWVAADVEDTIKKVETSGAGKPAAATVASAMASPSMSSPASMSGASSFPKTGEAQAVRVSDLISGTDAAKNIAKEDKKTSSFMASAAAMKPAAMTMSDASVGGAGKSGKLMLIGAIVLIVIFAGLAGFFFFQNQSLSGKVSSLTAESAGITTQLSTLTAQVNASTTDFMHQIDVLNATNKELAQDLSFYAIPPSLSGGVTSTAVEATGMLTGGGKVSYLLTTLHGARIVVTNSKDPRVVTALQPLVGSTSTVTIAGAYVPGAPVITVTAVNGTNL